MKRLVVVAALAALAGCGLGPDYQPPRAETPAEWSVPLATQARGEEWWQAFDDPQMAALVVRALAANPNLMAAEASVRAARALAEKQAGGSLPQLDLSGDASRARTPATQSTAATKTKAQVANSFATGFDASWELDLWGKLARGVEAAVASAEASRAEADGVRLTLIGDVLRNYTELRGYQLRLKVAGETVAAYADTVDLTRVQFNAGTGTGLAVVRAEAQLASSRADLPSLQAQLRVRLHALSILTGQAPAALAALLGENKPVPRLIARPGLGMPADLVRQRPDLRQAERELASATAEIGVAEADLYPTLSLGGSIGLSAASAGSLVELAARSWSFGPSLVLPLFDGGTRRAELAYRRAKAEQAEAAWRQSVLTALAEVEDALITWDRQQARRDGLIAAVHTSRAAFDLAAELNAKGMSDYLDVLDAQRELRSLEAQLAEAEVAAATDAITLYKAVGGGVALP